MMVLWQCMSVGLASMATQLSTRFFLELASCLPPYTVVNRFFSVDVEIGYNRFESDKSYIDG